MVLPAAIETKFAPQALIGHHHLFAAFRRMRTDQFPAGRRAFGRGRQFVQPRITPSLQMLGTQGLQLFQIHRTTLFVTNLYGSSLKPC